MEKQIWTIGHSNKSFEEFLLILKNFNISAIADVRRFPSSKKYPHFNKEILKEYLLKNGITYFGIPELGGRRTPVKDSKNTVWKNVAFRGYADYMETSEFQKGIKILMDLSGKYKVAIMCAEVLWWSCHRSLISDYLKVSRFEVIHILSETKSEVHPFTSPAKVINGKLSYGSDQLRLL